MIVSRLSGMMYGFDLPDADEYPPMEQWEIDEAKAEILADEDRLGKLEVIK